VLITDEWLEIEGSGISISCRGFDALGACKILYGSAIFSVFWLPLITHFLLEDEPEKRRS